MEIIDNINNMFGDDLKKTVAPKSKLRIPASCFSIYAFEAFTGITEEKIKKLATRKPLRVVFRDSGFSSDALKINVDQIFKLLSPDTEVKVI